MPARFLQLHTLTSYPASLLNRDDAGFAKRMPFGGAVRTRISSQCLKRHWRVYEGENSLRTIDAPETVCSRVSFERYVVQPLMKADIPENVARPVVQKLLGKVLGSERREQRAQRSGGRNEREAPAAPPASNRVATPQVTVLGRPELDYLCLLAKEISKTVIDSGMDPEKAVDERTKDKGLRENLKALKPGTLFAGLGAALFGRMVTGDILARTDGAIHVAHALTVHGHMTESDYFTAIDELERDEGEQGSGHINASELTSGLFYGYVVVDVNGLVSNVGDGALAGNVVERLVHIVATVSPGAKKGSTAPYAYSHLVLAESGNAQPRTLQNAFIDPVRPSGNIIDRAYDALRHHLEELDAMYGKKEQRAHAGLETGDRFENRMPLGDLAKWAGAQVVE